MNRPAEGEYASFYAPYVTRVQEVNGIKALEISGRMLTNVLMGIPAEKGTYKYQPGKWSINELVLHIIDSEVIFASRALRIARGDKTPLPGFEQDDYVRNSFGDYSDLGELTALFYKTRELSLSLFKTFPQQLETNIGNASGSDVSLRALCFIIAGHTLHHLDILKKRYL
jgi:hypothetical protein